MKICGCLRMSWRSQIRNSIYTTLVNLSVNRGGGIHQSWRTLHYEKKEVSPNLLRDKEEADKKLTKLNHLGSWFRRSSRNTE